VRRRLASAAAGAEHRRPERDAGDDEGEVLELMDEAVAEREVVERGDVPRTEVHGHDEERHPRPRERGARGDHARAHPPRLDRQRLPQPRPRAAEDEQRRCDVSRRTCWSMWTLKSVSAYASIGVSSAITIVASPP